MRPGVTWNPAPFKAQVKNNSIARMRRAMTILVAYAKTEMQELGKGIHSAKDEFPAVQSALLRTNITMGFDITVNDVIGYFGVLETGEKGKALEYAYFLEIGTSKMEPRPWLTLTLDAKMKEVKKILGAV